jgi:hypothetical protein
VYRGLSNATLDVTLDEAWRAFQRITRLIDSARAGRVAGLPPLLERNLDKVQVGLSPYGLVSITIDDEAASRGEVEELVKWLRDNVGECDVPLYMRVHGRLVQMQPLEGLHNYSGPGLSNQQSGNAASKGVPGSYRGGRLLLLAAVALAVIPLLRFSWRLISEQRRF